MDQEKINRQKSQRWANIEHTADYGDSWGYDDNFSGSDSETPAIPSLPKLEIPSAIIGDKGSSSPNQEECRKSWIEESEEEEDTGTEAGHWKSNVIPKIDDVSGTSNTQPSDEFLSHDSTGQDHLEDIPKKGSIHNEPLNCDNATEQALHDSFLPENMQSPKLNASQEATQTMIPKTSLRHTNEKIDLIDDNCQERCTEDPAVDNNVDISQRPPIPNAPNLLPELKYGNHDWMDRSDDSDEYEQSSGLWKRMTDLQQQLTEKSEQIDLPESLADENELEGNDQNQINPTKSYEFYNEQELNLKVEQSKQELEPDHVRMWESESKAEEYNNEASNELPGPVQIPQPIRSHSSGSLSTGSWSVASFHKSAGDKLLVENSKLLNRHSSTLKSSNSEDEGNLLEIDRGDSNSFTLSNKLDALDIEHENRYDLSDEDIDHNRFQDQETDTHSQDKGEVSNDNEEVLDPASSLESRQQRGDSINFGHWRPDTSNFRDNFIKSQDLADRHTIFEQPEEIEEFEPDEVSKLPSNIDIDNISAVTSSLPGASLLDSQAEVKEVEDSYFKELDDSNDKIEVKNPEDLNALKHEKLLIENRGSEDSAKGEFLSTISEPRPVSQQDRAPQQCYDYTKIMTMTNSRMKVEELSKARNIEYQVKTGLDEWLTFMLSSSSSDNNYQHQNDQLGPHARKAYEDVDQGNYHQHHQLSDLARKPSILNGYHTPKILKTSNRKLEKVGDIGKGIFSKGRKRILKSK
ncbi:BA75_01129T0 [Komagataella pastoris]|uniref:BA75_01129T0 n=1 Tax=Komagataella pastoris TaxID=4922 RepID=A0A1B2J9G8_PICPA|nr:BA75_01129T0 [Komagataella pastoris]